MKLIQVKLPRTEEYVWVGAGIHLKTCHNGTHLLHGEEITSEEKNRILDTLEQKGVELIHHPDFTPST